MTYLKAFLIAYKIHKGQKDKAGKPYIWHPLRVAAAMPAKDLRIIALLHDVLEDSNLTSMDLLLKGIPPHIVSTIELLTRTPQKPYDIYIQELGNDYMARMVKLADLKDNMNLKRLKIITDEDRQRQQKYEKAYNYLKYKDEITQELFKEARK